MNFIKKSVAFACVAMLGLGLFSCKKEYTCVCTTTVTGFDPIESKSTVTATKKQATDACEGLDAVSEDTSCELE